MNRNEGAVSNRYRFAGEQFDQSLATYYLRARYYSAASGRFTRRDTYEGRRNEPLTLHKYLYAHNNPVNFTDPTGLFTLTEQVAASVMIGILADLAFPQPVLTASGKGDSAYDPAVERILFSLIAGGVLVGIANGLRSGADEIVSNSANNILSGDELFELLATQQAKGIPPERIAGFVIHGTKEMSGGTFQRSILEISKTQGQVRNFKEFVQLLTEFEKEATKAGASNLRILSYHIVNTKISSLLSNPRFVERYGIAVRQLNEEVVEIVKKI